MNKLVRDLAPVRGQALAQRESGASEVLRDWAADWLPADAAWQPQVRAMCSTESAINADATFCGVWKAHGLASSSWAQAHELADARLAAMMSGRERTSPSLPEADWARQVAGTALADLHARMLGGGPEQGHQDRDHEPDLRRLSGVIVVHEASLGLSWAWGRALAQASKASTAVDSLAASLGALRAQVGVGLGEVDITMSDLLALQIGDVVRFPALLTAPVPLFIGTGEQDTKPAGQAYLGQQGGKVAVSLSSSLFK